MRAFLNAHFAGRMRRFIVAGMLPLLLVAVLAPATVRAQSVFDRIFDAVDANSVAEVRSLLALGVDVNTADRDGNSLLAIAARNGHRETVNLLLKSGARVETRNRFGETPLMYAALSGNEAIVRDLLARPITLNPDGPAWTPMHYAALRGHVGVLALLVDRGANVNAVSENGTTALMLAASEGRLDTVSFLLKRGADPALVNDAGRTAETWARERDHLRVVELLQAARRK
jgi:ankyrin repeat protein